MKIFNVVVLLLNFLGFILREFIFLRSFFLSFVKYFLWCCCFIFFKSVFLDKSVVSLNVLLIFIFIKIGGYGLDLVFLIVLIINFLIFLILLVGVSM